LMTAAQIADELGIHRNNVLKAMREGWLPAKQYGKVWLAARSDVEHYRDRKKRGGGNQPKKREQPPAPVEQPVRRRGRRPQAKQEESENGRGS